VGTNKISTFHSVFNKKAAHSKILERLFLFSFGIFWCFLLFYCTLFCTRLYPEKLYPKKNTI
jgi:hypothetical protein